MSAINSITESWNNHTFQEVETHIKGNYLPLTSVSVGSISSGVANVLTLNSSNAVKKTSLSDLASLLGEGLVVKQVVEYSNLDVNDPPSGLCVGWKEWSLGGFGYAWILSICLPDGQASYCAQLAFPMGYKNKGALYIRVKFSADGTWGDWTQLHTMSS